MSGEFIELYVSAHKGRYHGVYTSATCSSIAFEQVDDACEHFIRLLITTDAEPKFYYGTNSKKHFQEWLNNQPNKTELAELLNLQEMVW